MSSPGGGRGKGIRSTPRKAILQPSEEQNFSQVSPRRQLSQSYEQPHFSHYYDQPNFDQAAQEANFLQSSQHTHTSMLSPSVGRRRGMRASPRKTFSHASRQPNFSSQDQQFWQPSPQIYQPTWSPSCGRGRGIRTSPRKAFSQPSKHAYGMQHAQQPYFSQPPYYPNTLTMERAKWTSPFVKSFLEACAEEIEENGRAVNGFNKQAWARIVNAVMGKTGRKFTKKQLKDKHDRLKEEWRAWILVAEDKRQTGLGRNPETGAITGPDHWWDAMIAGGMDPASGSYFGNNENTGANNLFGIFGDGTNYNDGDLYNNVNYVHATNSSNTIPEIWSRAGSGAPLGSTSNASLFRNEETENGSCYGGTDHGSSSNQCGGFQNEGIEDGGEYGASETEEEDPMETDESLLLEDEDDVPEHVAHAVYQKDMQYIEMLKNHALEYVPVEIVRIPYHTSTHNGFDWVMSVLTCPNPRRCPENFSMTSEVFVKLCEELVYKYGFHTIRRHAIGIFESLAMFLCILRGCSLKLVGELLNRGQATCSRQINKVLLCVTRMAKEEIQPRDNHPHSYLSRRPQYRHFMDCIGAMDGTHVLCNPPPKDATKYFGRKGGHTMNILAICDFDLCFTFASAGWEGSMHDYHVFKECVYGRGTHMFPHPPNGKYYLVDSGYPNCDGYLAPYKGYTYHLEDFRRSRKRHMDPYEYYNRWHSSLRSAIERTFGVWKSRWRMMKETSTYPLRIHKLFVIASMAIHNYIIRNSVHDDELEEAIWKDERYVFQDLPDVNPMYAAQEDTEGFIYPQSANTLDMEVVRHGIMKALNDDRASVERPQRRPRN